ncbi:hypothetical protein MD535_19330 [Vibrio sp. ZSDZ65]|uniref:Lipoprotein n=1 Tax=Vibrio qingdaonensis TaxID=2829491 RepID=A0A9X3CRC5_9VIBR|nr:hypothetical protein [Vibrio qingdaonensis]MCW8348147.1 hypothetical protein [Vibrio qingdaonensis]
MSKKGSSAFKTSCLTMAVAFGLAGCGGGDSDSGAAPSAKKQVNTFVDAAVDGLYYQAANGSGFTVNGGQYEAATTDTVTFFIGGESGLKVGAASNRDVISPFEAAGTYERAINLAILLQSLDTKESSENLTLPATLTGNISQTELEALANISLDDVETIIYFLKNIMGISDSDIVSEADATAHMKTALSTLNRGSDAAPAMFKRGSGNIIRDIYIDQYQLHTLFDNIDGNEKKEFYVHADKTLKQADFDKVRKPIRMIYQLNADTIKLLASSSDASLGSNAAASYLTCIATNDCTGATNSRFNLTSPYLYKLNNPEELTPEQALNYDGTDTKSYLPHFFANTISDLNKVVETDIYDDSDPKDGSDMQYNIYSQSFDEVTGVLTVLEKKFNLGAGTAKTAPSVRNAGGVSEKIRFIYQVDSEMGDRYVDFTGKWVDQMTCDNGEIAKMNFDFQANQVVVSGQDCGSSAPEDMSETLSYAEIANIDYWWFNQNGREAKATLTELNSTVRFCDEDNYVMGNECSAGKEYFVKWSYMPAGSDWDEGVLTRRKMRPDGTTARVSTMQKVF